SAGEAAPEQRRITVPKTAVHQRAGREMVWVVREGRVEERAVGLDADDGDNAVIAAGLEAGEVVVIEGPENLEKGARVTVEK
ncbi:MAG: efflux RND transporter periplasmic adaptor subunit, partial [Candidatus Hydrogenedentes bacterium]|nr:efflux RND transporter periplasmic adaptor subunit [Candidatus Hydrogenedentota bacterium]